MEDVLRRQPGEFSPGCAKVVRLALPNKFQTRSSNSNGVTTEMAMWKRVAIFHGEIYADGYIV